MVVTPKIKLATTLVTVNFVKVNLISGTQQTLQHFASKKLSWSSWG